MNSELSETKIGIIIFDDVDLMDVTGPKEVFSTIKIANDKEIADPVLQLYNSTPVIDVDYISVVPKKNITTADGTTIQVGHHLDNISSIDYDVIVLPGGKGVHFVKQDEKLLDFIRRIYQKNTTILSVCTGAYLIAEANILDTEPITTHHRHFDIFEKTYPRLNVIRDKRYVESNNLVITSGVSSGIDGALRIIERIYGTNLAKRSAKSLNYRI